MSRRLLQSSLRPLSQSLSTPVRTVATAAVPSIQTEEISPQQSNVQSIQPLALSPAEHSLISSALRVNQAGELAATLIYTAQTPLVVSRQPSLSPLMQHMYDQEAGHLSTFNAMIPRLRVRPSALRPVWMAAASVLGWSTAKISTPAAMACTEAVETVIGEHYNRQVERFLGMIQEREDRGEIVETELRELVDTIRRIRDEELEHLDHAVEEGAKEAEAYPVLTEIVKQGCRGAIWVSERI